MILFVDDEENYVDTYIEELRMSGYEVSFHDNVDEALRVFEENLNRLDLLILDIMMPPASSFRDVDTETGLRTGVRFYEKVRPKMANRATIILTNVRPERLASNFHAESRCWIFSKEECLPHELVEEVNRILTTS